MKTPEIIRDALDPTSEIRWVSRWALIVMGLSVFVIVANILRLVGG